MSLGADLRAVVLGLLHPFIRLALRFVRVDDPWERFSHDVPLRLFGHGSHRDFSWYLEGESTVSAKSLEEIQEWLLACEYVDDRTLFNERDFWQHPRTFEHMRRGDCEDHALWAWRKLVEIGADAELVSGQHRHPDDPKDKNTGHVWVVLRRGGEVLLFETAAKTREQMLRPLHEVRAIYRPEVGVDASRQRFQYFGYLLTLRERFTADKPRVAAPMRQRA
jgi:hypothetical protein